MLKVKQTCISQLGIWLEEAALPKGDRPVILAWMRLLNVFTMAPTAHKGTNLSPRPLATQSIPDRKFWQHNWHFLRSLMSIQKTTGQLTFFIS